MKAVGGLPSELPYMVSAQDQTVGGHWAKGTKKRDSKHKMSTNRGISPSLSITLWSHTEKRKKKTERSFQGLLQLTGGAAVNKGGGEKKKKMGVKREKSAFLQRRTGGGKRKAGCWRKLLRPSQSPAVTNHFCSGSEGRRNVKIFE